MGSKSNASQVDPHPDPPSTNAPPGGKREADNVVVQGENVVSKKQKIVNSAKKIEVPLSVQSATAAASDGKNSSTSNESKEEDGNDDSFNKEDDQHLRKSVEVSVATTTLDANRENISNEDEKVAGDDGSRHLETSSALKLNNQLLLDHPVRLDLSREKAELTSPPLVTKTLYLGNLSFSIEEDDVRDFFKDVGEIAELRFAIRDDRFLGWAHVEFTTAEAAQEALKLNNKVIVDRRVILELARQRGTYTRNLELARQRGVYTRGSSSMDTFSQRGGEGQVKTIYVRGFKPSDGYDNIKIALVKHFEKCGDITRVAVLKDHESGAPKGVAFIDFAGNNEFRKALQLNGSELGGSKLIVDVAKIRKRGEVSEYGYGAGGWVKESGFSGGWSSRGYGSGRENSGWRTESGSGRECGSGNDWRSSGRNGYGNISWHSERGYGGSCRGTSGSRQSGSSRGGFGGSWGRANAFGYVATRASLGFGGGWGRGIGSSVGRGVGSGYSGRGFSSSHLGRFSGSYGSNRGRAPRSS
ncbi:Nucleotide-binding, alpha-beta plait [Artemisia annua]|uniref:Nucleotide-binding, alpha-beta plait n=1 Tax=Artemisia annua TaxID=35608 RepID=A0A2U1LSP9_ARTAN|nr:Nucleotide-binding, alpha-beta plait [Artemisia annua]